MRWKTLETHYVHRAKWLTAKVEKVALPNGRIYDEYYTLEYPEWINVIAITKDGKMILERQWRHALGIVSTEIPAGVVEEGEEPMEAARRELEEETGFVGGEWMPFMVSAPNPSSMNNRCHTFLAQGVEPKGTCHWDATEDIEVNLCPLDEVFEMLKSGAFQQALMLAPLWKFFATR